MDRRLGTLPITSSQTLMLLHVLVVYDLHTRTVSWCLVVDLARTAVGLFITLAQQSGTLFRMNLETRNSDSFDSFARFLKIILFSRY